MNIQFVGIDPETDEDGCPTVWVDTGTDDLLIQSYQADDETTAAAHLGALRGEVSALADRLASAGGESTT